MLFLIEYDQERSQIVSKSAFLTEERGSAAHARSVREIELNALGISREVVLLEADDEAALRATHSRYFDTPSELILGVR